MFDILFGWRKASKCKKLIKRVQCRLKLVKNKRCSIIRQLRDDVAQLIKCGHCQIAFNRVEQLFKDETIVAVYDLLDHFCEFIIIHISYIRRHKDCPNDINEAVSSLIFASARFGDLPELPVIRKLFGERYGQKFAMAALELRRGNLVNHQIRDNLLIKSVPDEVKYRLVDEIARSCIQTRPLALEYSSQLQQLQAKVPNNDVKTSYNRNKEYQSEDYNIMEGEGKIVHVDISSEGKKFPMEPSSESSSNKPEEIIYIDEIEEFQSPMCKDQRLFLFKSSIIATQEKFELGYNKSYESWLEMVENCSLEHPCYVCISDGNNDLEIPTSNSKRRIATLAWFQHGRPKGSAAENIIGSNSFRFRQLSHLSNGNSSSSPNVHPKLPDYDELAAKFKALKKSNLQNKNQ